MSRKQVTRETGMRPSASAKGSQRSGGEPTGLLLARVAAGRRNSGITDYRRTAKEAEK